MNNRPSNCREMAPEDLDAVLNLLDQLGYDLILEELISRFESVRNDDGHLLLVVEQKRRVNGFLHAFARKALEKPPEVIVQAMVVAQTARRAGIGRALATAAEDWARERGLSSIALHSDVERVDAHAFYVRLGYEQTVTSGLLRKRL